MRELDPTIEERNYAKQPLGADEIDALIDRAGGLSAVISTRNATVKANGWDTTLPDRATFVAAAAADNNLVRRPILIVGDEVVIGKDLAAIRKLLGG